MENTKLRNCPFCGSESAVIKAMNLIPTDYKVVCTSCGATAGWTDPKSEAIAAWNRRADDVEKWELETEIRRKQSEIDRLLADMAVPEPQHYQPLLLLAGAGL